MCAHMKVVSAGDVREKGGGVCRLPTEMFAFDSGSVCTSFAKCLCFLERVLALDSRWPKGEDEGEVTRRTESFIVAQSGHMGGLVTRVVPKRERFVFE